MIEVQCSSCHTRYRIDEQVLPEGTPTFKCSRCGHVFSFEPRVQESRGDKGADEPGESAPRPHAPAQKLDPSVAAAALECEGGVKTETPEPAVSTSNEDLITDDPAAREDKRAESIESVEAVEATGEKPAARPLSAIPSESGNNPEENPLARSFEEREEEKSGENPTFDFREEQTRMVARGNNEAPDDDDKWQVGDPEDGVERLTTGPRAFADQGSTAHAAVAAVLAQEAEAGNAGLQPRARKRAALEQDFVNENEAPLYNRTLVHSARLFIAIFAACAIGYGILTLLIHSAPAAASEMLSHVPVIGERFMQPVMPASLVALRNVSSHYQRLKDGHTALVITGAAENVAPTALHVVRVEVDLRDASARQIAAQAVYCGNNLAPKMVGEMTPHEIEFFQRLNPPKSFALDPSAQCPFVLVFIDPPAGVNRFDISVAKAVPAAETLSANKF
ncbi:MAG: zinc-ribbon domain-containing protein [Candidatus Binataceae bacterium]